MTEFIEIGYYAHLPDELVRDLRRRELRGNDNDLAVLRATYQTDRLSALIINFSLDALEAKAIVINDDGTADLPDRRFESKSTYAKFIEHIRKGRVGDVS